MSIRHLYNTSVSVSRPARTHDTQGGFIDAPPTLVESAMRCRISPASATERTIAQRDEAYLTHVLFCDEGEQIQRGDLIQETSTGRDFTVLHIRPPSRRGHHSEIDLEQSERGR